MFGIERSKRDCDCATTGISNAAAKRTDGVFIVSQGSRMGATNDADKIGVCAGVRTGSEPGQKRGRPPDLAAFEPEDANQRPTIVPFQGHGYFAPPQGYRRPL